MAINKQITLTEKGVNSGPYYVASYSLNGINYSVIQPPLFLPEIGSSAIISVPDTTLYILLSSLGTCTNQVVNPVPDAILGDFGVDYNPLDFN